MKVADLEGDALDYWVAKADGLVDRGTLVTERLGRRGNWIAGFVPYRPSFDWQQGGPIIERERISTWHYDEIPGERTDVWFAAARGIHGWDDGTLAGAGQECTGQTALIAAMRAYVASKFGDEVPTENI